MSDHIFAGLLTFIAVGVIVVLTLIMIYGPGWVVIAVFGALSVVVIAELYVLFLLITRSR
jgi:hypothetical protein